MEHRGSTRTPRRRAAMPDRTGADPTHRTGKSGYRARRRRPRSRPRSPRWARLCVWVGAVVMVLSFGTVAAVKVVIARYDGSLNHGNLLGNAGTKRGGDIRGPLNFLIIGSNYRTDDPSNGERADTLMIAHITKDLKAAYLISVPRDLWYTIKPDRKIAPKYSGSTEKIDAALNYGGVPLMTETVRDLTGISFDGAMMARFDGFTKAVQDLGGVNMCVDEETTSVHVGWDANGKETKPYSNTGGHPIPVPGVTPMVYHPGCQYLKPWQALDFVRQRELLPDGDFGRQRHQQQFITAVLKQTTSAGTLSDPVKLDKTIRDIGQAISVDTNGMSTLDLAYALRGIRSDSLVGLKAPSHPQDMQDDGGNTVSAVVGDPGIDDLWKAIRDDTLDAYALANPAQVNPLHPGG